MSTPFFIFNSSFSFIFATYIQALNLKLYDIKLIFVFPNLSNSTSTVFVTVISIYLILAETVFTVT